jgi:RES domain-containing protein
MVEAWRIVKSKYVVGAFSGQSASDYGGRWNSPGTRIVYTASSTSLALLEILVHLGFPQTLPSCSLILAIFDEGLALDLDVSSLPDNWREQPPPRETQVIGDEWVAGGRSAVLAVPSVIIPHETNLLINPLHPDFAKISIQNPIHFPIDGRLAPKSSLPTAAATGDPVR